MRIALNFIVMELVLREFWGSQSAGFRQAIRQDLLRRYGSSAHTDLLDLTALPQFNNGFVSISHTRGLGGYIWSEQPIGLDIEPKDRATLTAVQRMSSKSELAEAPNPTALWCAKEAAFKALFHVHRQPQVISELTVSDWTKAEEDFHFTVGFTAKPEARDSMEIPAMRGVFRGLEKHVCAWVLAHPSDC